MLSPFAVKKLEHLMMDYLKITCPEGECYGVLAVHRINWALGMLHLILAAFLIGVQSTRNRRSSIQNGYPPPPSMILIDQMVGPQNHGVGSPRCPLVLDSKSI